jgi:IclR family transcriptional regulator, KDG regulon repressor
MTGQASIQVLERTLDILEALAQAESGMALSGLAQCTGLSKSTIHRILATLKKRGYAEQNHDGNYEIGPKLIETVSCHINALDLSTESRPCLAALRKELDLTTHLGILDGPYVVYVERISLFPRTRLYTQVGYRSPAYCSSMGKCLLACLSGERLTDILDQCSFEQFTKNTCRNKKEFRQLLRQVRQQGWAMDDEEYQPGHRCVGAPVFDYRGDAVAAISASGTSTDINEKTLEKVKDEVIRTACEISKRMGYTYTS